MRTHWHSLLIDASREEIAAHEAELHALQGSARYRVGGWLLGVWPPSVRTAGVLLQLLRHFFRRRARRSRNATLRSPGKTPQAAVQASTIIFGPAVPGADNAEGVWACGDPRLVARRLDMPGRAGTLIIRTVDQQILRRVGRLRYLGWRVHWLPARRQDEADPALLAYARAHTDPVPGGSDT